MNDIPKLVKAAIALLAISLAVAFLLRGRDYAGATLKFDAAVLEILKKSGIGEDGLRYEKRERYKSGRHSFLKITRHYDTGGALDAEDFVAQVKGPCKALKFNIAASATEREGSPPGAESVSFRFSFKERTLYELKLLDGGYAFLPPPATKGAKIAIVIDDFGYNTNNLTTLFSISSPVTISVLPNLTYSAKIAREAGKRQVEVMLHLPLEPHGGLTNLEKGTIMVDMPPEQVKKLLDGSIKSIPGLRGVSNHMGSRATESRDFMKVLFTELQKRDLYFLDNLVTDKSVCREMASEIRLRAAARSVFLDNESDEAYIEGQILQTANLAAGNGWAIGVGHDRPQTIKVIAKVIPLLERAGFELVHVSELVK